MNKSNINEASLSRVWQHFKDSSSTIVIFTAFRDENTYEDNITLNKKFAAELKNAGFGYFYVEGHFPENAGTNDEVDVKEDSIFAIANKNKGQNLIDLAHKLANKANQDSIIVKDAMSGKIYFLDKNGNKDYLHGELKPGKLGKYYTKLRNKKESNTFVFESEKDGIGYFESFRNYITESINESSLSRIYNQTLKYDSGTISAFRSSKDCNTGEDISKSENKKRSSILKSKLLKLGYGVTGINGTYIENYNTDNEITVNEDSYLVIDIKNDGKLKFNLIKLGNEFEQDSITYQSKKSNKYYLISSSKCENGYPGFGKIGKEIELGKPIFGKDGEFHSKINGRPFVFESINYNIKELSDFYPTEIRSIIELSKLEL